MINDLLFLGFSLVKFGQHTPYAPDFSVQGWCTNLGISSKCLIHFTNGLHLPGTCSLVNDVVQKLNTFWQRTSTIKIHKKRLEILRWRIHISYKYWKRKEIKQNFSKKTTLILYLLSLIIIKLFPDFGAYEKRNWLKFSYFYIGCVWLWSVQLEHYLLIKIRVYCWLGRRVL